MATDNYINSNLDRITVKDANGNITGVSVGTLAVTTSANLNAIGNITIGGGSNAQVLTSTNGSTLGFGRTAGPIFCAFPSATLGPWTMSTWTNLALNSEEYDSDNYYNTTTGRFTPLVAGYYYLSFSTQFFTTTADSMPPVLLTSITKNGVSYKRGFQMQNINNGGTLNIWDTIATCTMYMNGTTDYAGVQLFINTINTTSWRLQSGVQNTRFEGYWLRA